ncbi:MAG TPA: condensation domain-containing protein [Blastocatellia bacterium]|jgi:hypothetical protein|nr:condensation domain-containing protein [Blastocatellia bacterium]
MDQARESYPMTHQQQGLWYLSQTMPARQRAGLNLCYGINLHGPLDYDAMERATNALIARHASLRTQIALEKGELRQVIRPHDEREMPTIDLTRAAHVKEAERQTCEEEANRKFDLSAGPLSSFKLVRLRDDTHTLIHNTHHIITDGISVHILRRDLATLYNAYASGAESQLPPAGLQQYDHALWQQERLRRGDFDSQERYWTNQLARELPVLNLPTDYERPATRTFRGANYRQSLPQELGEKLQLHSFRNRATLSSTLLAAFAVLLSKYCGQQAIMMGTNFAGRHQPPGLLNSVGLFINTVALLLELPGDATWRDFLGHVNKKSVDAYDNQDYPLQLVVRKLNPRRDMSRPPLFQVAFNMEAMPPDAINWARLEERGWERFHTETCVVDLLLYVTKSGAGLDARLEYCADLFSRETIAGMMRHYVYILRQIAETNNLALSDIRLPAPTPNDPARQEATGGSITH